MLCYITLKMTKFETYEVIRGLTPQSTGLEELYFKHGIAHLSMSYYWLNCSLNIEHATKLISWRALIQLGHALCM